jgi:hypothetical protein
MAAPCVLLDHIPATSSEYFNFVTDQHFALLDSFELESGAELLDVTVAYKTWGKLNAQRDNCLVVCHALSGSSDIEDWWGPLLGSGKAFDPSRYFVFCANVLGSPYGTTSSLSINPETGRIYGPDFPQTTIRDDIRSVFKCCTLLLPRFLTWAVQFTQAYSGCVKNQQHCSSCRRFHGRYGNTRVAAMHTRGLREEHYPHIDLS